MNGFHRVCRKTLRLAAVPAALLGVLVSAGVAQASPLGPGDLDKARAASSSPAATALLQRALEAQQAPGGAGVVGKQPAGGAQPTVVDPAAIPVYALNADFVKGTSREPGTLWYVAFAATRGEVHQTLFTAPDASGAWKPVNVAGGDTEQRMAARAGGERLLLEPQIGAWYSVAGERLRPLNARAVESIGASPVSVASYQRKVAAAYRDKLPGGSYDQSGAAGGFDAKGSTTAGGGAARPAEGPSAEGRAAVRAVGPVQSAGPQESAGTLVMQRAATVAGLAVVLGLAALGWLIVRRRAPRS